MRFSFLVGFAILMVTPQLHADVIFVDDFTSADPGDDGIVGPGATTDRTFGTSVSDPSIMQVNSEAVNAQDRELQSTRSPFSGSPFNGSTATVTTSGGGSLIGSVHGGTDFTRIRLSYDGGGGDGFGLADNGIDYDFATQTGGNGQNYFFVDGSDGSGNNVSITIEVRNGSNSSSLTRFFDDETGGDGLAEFSFNDFVAAGSILNSDFFSLSGIEVTFQGLVDPGSLGTAGSGFTVNSIYAHNPEPSSLAIIGGLGLLGFAASRRNRK